MTELFTENVTERQVTQNSEVSLWLLQKDDTPFLWLSFLSSLFLHGLLFLILAATRIFHPFTGDSGEFELVWFSSSVTESDGMTTAKKAENVGSAVTPSRGSRMDPTRQLKYPASEKPAAPSPPARDKAPVKPPESPTAGVADTPVRDLPPPEADAEMVISRFGGKVVEIVDKDSDIPVYKTFSAAQKSPGQRAVVQYLDETESHASGKPAKTKKMQPPVLEPVDKKTETAAAGRMERDMRAPEAVILVVEKKSTTAAEPVNEKEGNGAVKRLENDAPPPVAERVTIVEKIRIAKERPVHLRQSSSVVKAVPASPPAARETGSMPTEQPQLAAVPVPSPKNQTEGNRPASRVTNGETPLLQRTEVSPAPPERRRERESPVTPKADPVIHTIPPVLEAKPKQVIVQPSPVEPEKTRTIHVPPLAGGLPERPRERGAPVTPKTDPVNLRIPPVLEARPKQVVVKPSPVEPEKLRAIHVPPLDRGLPERPREKEAPVTPKAVPVIDKIPSVLEAKPKQVVVKPSPAEPEKPRALYVPPLDGDLKVVITGGEDFKVEAVFREFRKARRGRPLTRGEARNTRSVPLKRARTKQNVHETVIEIAEEGVYDLTVRSANGKPVTAAFVIRIHEKRAGAVTKSLEKRTLPDGALLARILMPEGIFWDDESYFTGTMEDSDSMTRFHTETGLVWREYR